MMVDRRTLKPGDRILSSFGYVLLVTDVYSAAGGVPNRGLASVPDEHAVTIVGHLHGAPDGPIRNEVTDATITAELLETT